MGCGPNIVPGFNEVNKKIKDPGLEMKIEQGFNRKPVLGADFDKQDADWAGNTRVKYKDSKSGDALRRVGQYSFEFGDMTRLLKNMNIPHRLKIKGGKPVGITIPAQYSESFGSDAQVTFDNMFDMLVAMGMDPKGPAAQFNHKLSDEQSIRLERKWIRQTGENWQGQETSVEEFNSYI